MELRGLNPRPEYHILGTTCLVTLCIRQHAAENAHHALTSSIGFNASAEQDFPHDPVKDDSYISLGLGKRGEGLSAGY